MSQCQHLQWSSAGGCPLAQWRMAPPARQKGEKKGKNGGVGSYYAPADGGKGINRSCLLFLSGKAYLGRQEGGDRRDRQEGWQMVSPVEGSGWLRQRGWRGCVRHRMEFPVCSGSLWCVSPSCTEVTHPAHHASSSGISPILLRLLLASLGDRGPDVGRHFLL